MIKSILAQVITFTVSNVKYHLILNYSITTNTRLLTLEYALYVATSFSRRTIFKPVALTETKVKEVLGSVMYAHLREGVVIDFSANEIIDGVNATVVEYTDYTVDETETPLAGTIDVDAKILATDELYSTGIEYRKKFVKVVFKSAESAGNVIRLFVSEFGEQENMSPKHYRLFKNEARAYKSICR